MADEFQSKLNVKGRLMMKMSLKQIIALLLVLVMTVALFGGCAADTQQEDQSSESKTSESEKDSEDEESKEEADEGTGWEAVSAKVDIPQMIKKDPAYLEWMDDTSPITFSVYYVGVVSDQEFAWNTPIEQKITELTGVTIDGMNAADAEGNELTLMIASGEPLPDMFNNLSGTSVHYHDLVDSGSLYSMDELINEYCPLFWDLMEEFPIAFSREADGSLYRLPRQATTSAAEPFYGANGWFAVRGDICEHYGIDPLDIKTLADMEEFIEKVMADKDTLWPELQYPISTAINMSWLGGRPWYASFGGVSDYNERLEMKYDKENDSVHYWIEDEYGYQALKYSWSLAQKGWITEATFSYPGDYDAMASGSVLIASGSNMWYPNYILGDLEQNVPGAYYSLIPMIAAEEGMEVGYADSMNVVQGSAPGVVITTDCENPERAIKFLEFMGSEYGQLLATVGVYGEDWEAEFDDNGKVISGTYIGEAATPEGSAARGILNYTYDWYNLSGNYDYFTGIFSNDPALARGAAYAWFDRYEVAPGSVMDTEPADSEYAVLRKQLETIMRNYQTDMVLAKDEATFDALYNECLQVMEENGLATLKEYVLGLTKEKITAYEKYGIEFN